MRYMGTYEQQIDDNQIQVSDCKTIFYREKNGATIWYVSNDFLKNHKSWHDQLSFAW